MATLEQIEMHGEIVAGARVVRKNWTFASGPRVGTVIGNVDTSTGQRPGVEVRWDNYGEHERPDRVAACDLVLA